MEFRGRYSFLSNMFDCKFEYNGQSYLNVESAFQAQKYHTKYHQLFANMNGFHAKNKGRKANIIVSEWNKHKLRIMKEILVCKFSQNPMMLKQLREIKEPIVEDNTWGDTYWGVCQGQGENNLGKILMEVRDSKEF